MLFHYHPVYNPITKKLEPFMPHDTGEEERRGEEIRGGDKRSGEHRRGEERRAAHLERTFHSSTVLEIYENLRSFLYVGHLTILPFHLLTFFLSLSLYIYLLLNS